MHLYPILRRGARLYLALGLLAGLCGWLAPSGTAAAASVGTDQGCYLVGQTVQLNGQGFGPYMNYVVTIDGVYLGQRSTDGSGSFAVPIYPGGLPAGAAQHVEQLTVSDGTTSAASTFTLTRRAGARVLASGGSARTLPAAFQVWGFSLSGTPRAVYVHYVNPSGRLRTTTALGSTWGQCGYLRTARRRLFPFSVSSGTWTLQLDTSPSYQRLAQAPVARIRVTIR